EAIAELKKDKKFQPVKAARFKAFMRDAEQGKASRKAITKRIRLVTHETKNNVLFVTQDKNHRGAMLHKNYIAKETIHSVDIPPSRSSNRSSDKKSSHSSGKKK